MGIFYNIKNISKNLINSQKAGIYQGSATLINRIVFFIIFTLIGRFYGQSELGKISTALNLANILQVFSDFGFRVIIQREASRSANIKKYFLLSLIIKSVSSIVLYSVVFVYYNISSGISLLYLSTCYFSIVLLSIGGFSFAYLIGTDRNREYFKINIISYSLILLLFVFIVLINKPDFIPLVFFVGGISQIYVAYDIIQSLTIKEIINWQLLKKWFMESIPVWIGLLSVFIYDKVDVLFLTIMKGTKESGAYYAPYTVLKSLTIITSFYLTNYFTKLSKNFNVGYKLYIKTIREELSISLIVGSSVFIVFVIFNKSIMSILYGNNFLLSSEILKVLSFAVIFIIFNYSFGTIFNSMNRTEIPMYGAILALIFNVTSNLIFIPTYGYWAAAYNTIGTELIMFSYLLVNYFRTIKKLSIE